MRLPELAQRPVSGRLADRALGRFSVPFPLNLPRHSPMMIGVADGKHPRVAQSVFDRLTGASRDDWRKWERRKLVEAKAPGAGYAWTEVVQAIALRALEDAGGMIAVVS